MIEPTDEMKMAAYRAARAWASGHSGHQQPDDRMIKAAIAAVLAIVERDHRERLADELEEHAIHLRNGAFKTGAVSIEYIQGVEGAAYQVRSGDLP